MNQVTLRLSDGTTFRGESFGYESPVAGEVVFNTAMSGYPEALTDPSYAGQIMVLTYPLIGNYGVPACSQDSNGISIFMESERIHASAIVVADYSESFSHWLAEESLADWLRREHITGITGVDTRALTCHLRDHGVMLGTIEFDSIPASPLLAEYEGVNFVDRVSCHEVVRYNEGAPRRVVLVDCGVKHNIIRSLITRGVEVVRVPWDFDFNTLDFDGLFLSNGPGDPNVCDITVDHIRTFLMSSKVRPLMGICLGNQLLAKAAGADVYKLKFGHRSHNQPVRRLGTNSCYITSQNHGYAVAANTLPREWQPMFVNLNDSSNEGIQHESKPWFSVQFHPEACSGPVDTMFLFDDFINRINA